MNCKEELLFKPFREMTPQENQDLKVLLKENDEINKSYLRLLDLEKKIREFLYSNNQINETRLLELDFSTKLINAIKVNANNKRFFSSIPKIINPGFLSAATTEEDK